MNQRIMRRALAGIVGASLLLGAGQISSAVETEATFTEAEYTHATVSASTMAPLIDATCTLRPGLTFTGVILKWKSVYDMSAIANVNYSPISGTNSGGTTNHISRANITQVAQGDGTYLYEANLNTGLLGGLLGTLLGATSTLAIQEQYPVENSQWLTPPKKFTLKVALGGLLGIGTSCTAIS